MGLYEIRNAQFWVLGLASASLAICMQQRPLLTKLVESDIGVLEESAHPVHTKDIHIREVHLRFSCIRTSSQYPPSCTALNSRRPCTT